MLSPKTLLFRIALTTSLWVVAQNSMGDEALTSKYLQNLGQYFGYDLAEYCKTGGPCSQDSSGGLLGGGSLPYMNTLSNERNISSSQLDLFYSYLGSLMGGINSTTPIPLVPPDIGPYSLLNSYGGRVYTDGQKTFVSILIDQQTYQSDPVSQAVLNILATPSDSKFCENSDGSCNFLTRDQVLAGVVGQLPPSQMVFSSEYNQRFLSQLNSNTLLTPMLYSDTSNDNNTSSTRPGKEAGLTATNQVQQALNFVRYAANEVNPIPLPTKKTYDDLLGLALNFNGQTPLEQQKAAQSQLTNYLSKLRVYAAQNSVGISNLYAILSKRLPQKTNDGNANSSEALNEFIMASWRLFSPQGSGGTANQQWLSQINHGSAATVQKEIAVLLAEINYQLYLSRQQQERLLLTQSILLIQNSQLTPPDNSQLSAADATGSGAGGNSGSDSGGGEQ